MCFPHRGRKIPDDGDKPIGIGRRGGLKGIRFLFLLQAERLVTMALPIRGDR